MAIINYWIQRFCHCRWFQWNNGTLNLPVNNVLCFWFLQNVYSDLKKEKNSISIRKYGSTIYGNEEKRNESMKLLVVGNTKQTLREYLSLLSPCIGNYAPQLDNEIVSESERF